MVEVEKGLLIFEIDRKMKAAHHLNLAASGAGTGRAIYKKSGYASG